MVTSFGQSMDIVEKAKRIKLLLTDVDGVLTDTGVFYSDAGEVMKRFSIRDGMGVQRLREMIQVETGIISGENSGSIKQRALKLKINELHLGIEDKWSVLKTISQAKKIPLEDIAYIGDDTNDIEAMQAVGLSACPADAMQQTRQAAHYVCENKGGYGAFREFAELIISARL